MATKIDPVDWLYEAFRALRGKARIAELCRYVLAHHEEELRKSGDLFYTWQYDIRWAAYQLRKSRKMKLNELSSKGIRELT